MGKLSRFITMLLIACLALSFAACVPDSDEGEQDTETVSTIKVWLHKAAADDEGKIYQNLVDTFNDSGYRTADDKKDLRIRLEFKGDEKTLQTAISAETLAGGLPDVIAIDAPQFAAYAKQNVIQSIDDYITQAQRDSYVSSVITQSTINGKLYGLSGMDAPGGMYYNKDIITTAVLEQAGISGYGTIENPWSWKDVEKVLTQLRTNGVTQRQIKLNLGFGTEGNMYLYSSLVYSAGGSFLKDGKVKGGLDSAESIAGLQMLEIPLKNYTGTTSHKYTGTNVDAFAQGLVPLQIFGPWDIATINKNYKSMNGKYDIMPMPVYESATGVKGSVATPCGSWGFAATRDTHKLADAAIVISYLTGKSASKLMYQGIGTFPTNKALYNEIAAFTSAGPMKSLADLLIQTAVPRPAFADYPKLSDAYNKIVEYIEATVNTPAQYNLAADVTARVNQI